MEIFTLFNRIKRFTIIASVIMVLTNIGSLERGKKKLSIHILTYSFLPESLHNLENINDKSTYNIHFKLVHFIQTSVYFFSDLKFEWYNELQNSF